MVIDLMKRAFYKPNWKLAVRKLNEAQNSVLDINNKEYNMLKTSGLCWHADPFVCRENDNIYVFTECYLKDKKKGVIAAGEYINDQIVEMRIIVEQDYHMSYPCIFKYASTFYMIPETANNRTIELYKAKKFPYQWEFVKILKEGIRCVDSTVFYKDNELYILGYLLDRKINRVCLFNLDMEAQTLTAVDEVEDDNSSRPAGRIYFKDGKLIRPVQISKRKYGEGIELREIVSMDKGCFQERILLYINAHEIRVNGEKRIDRIHTVNRIDNLEIIDYSRDSFELFRPIKLIKSLLQEFYSFFFTFFLIQILY